MKSANANIAVIGLRPRTGRATAVVLSGPADAPQLVKRGELILTDARLPATFQPYHEVMDLPWNESQTKVKPFVRAIEKVAAKALSDLVSTLASEGFQVAGVGIAGTADRDLARLGNFHIRAHAAEGLLFRQVLEFAAKANKLRYRTFIESNLQTVASAELGMTLAKLNKSLTSLGRSAGPPWRREQRVAASAAWLTLKRLGRFTWEA